MKKAIILLLVMLPVMVMSQTVSGYYKAFAGAAADTMTTGVTKTYLLDLGNEGGWAGKVYDIKFQVFNDLTSGTNKFTIKLYPSVDGTTFARTAADSSALYDSAADIVHFKEFTAQSARYWRVVEIGHATAQLSRIYGYVYVTQHR
jgi:hypothetical protein